MSTTIDKIIAEVQQLPPDEQRQLIEQLQAIVPASASTEEREDEFERELVAEGFLGVVAQLTATDEEIREYRAYQPIKAEGQPLSETIIEERC